MAYGGMIPCKRPGKIFVASLGWETETLWALRYSASLRRSSDHRDQAQVGELVNACLAAFLRSYQSLPTDGHDTQFRWPV